MKSVTFVGAPQELGRFGHIKTGDILSLTDHEARSLEGDKRFKAASPADVKKSTAKPEPVKAGDADAEKAADTEAERKASLAKANAETDTAELHQMTRERLLDRARALKADGKAIAFTVDDSRKNLIKAIRGATGEAAKAEDEVQD